MVEAYAFWDRLGLFPEHQEEFIGLFRSLLFGNILSIENNGQKEEEARRLLNFFITNFNSYSLGLIEELCSPAAYVSIFTLFRKAVRVLRKDGFISLVKRTLRR
jgi:hypothetical protein